MNTFTGASDYQQAALLIALLLAVFFHLMQGFYSFITHARRISRITSCALFVFSFALLTLLNDHNHNAFSPIAHFVRSLNSGFLWCLVIGLFICAAVRMAQGVRLSRHRVSINSIKQALDTLPAAICYFDASGMIRLCNHQMYRLFRTMTQTDLQSIGELHSALTSCAQLGGVIKLDDDSSTWAFPDGKVWRYSETTLTADDGRKYTETFFADITELYEKMQEIKKQSRKLANANQELRRLSENVAEMTREQEMLSFKTRLHDSLGAGLVAARQMLVQNRTTQEMDAAINLWSKSVSLLRHDNEQPYDKGELSDLLSDAAAIGITMKLDGELPDSADIAEVFLNAMRECLTNCIRHAGGTEIYVALRCDGNIHTLSITNNGAVPESEIVPGGGLTNLDNRVRYFGGEMVITSTPRFVLTITMTDRRAKQ